MNYLPIVSAFISTVIFMIALRPVVINLGIVDKPGGRKTHVGDIPIVGGMAMIIGFVLAMALLPDSQAPFQFLALSCGVLAFVGILDDRFDLPARLRIVAQVLVVLIMSYGDGLMIRDIGDLFGFGIISFGSMSWFFTLLVTVAVINAFNLVDGADGLAGSMALVALVCLAIVAGPGSMAFQVSIIAIAVIVAFLLFNFPYPANKSLRSFMGDGGSTMLGLVIAWITLSVSQGEARVVSPVVALWFASMPVFDLFTVFVRRIWKGKSPFTPDREHFHHLLKGSGMSMCQTLVTLTGLQAIYAGIALTGYFAGTPDAVMFAGWAVLGFMQYSIVTRLATAFRTNVANRASPHPLP